MSLHLQFSTYSMYLYVGVGDKFKTPVHIWYRIKLDRKTQSRSSSCHYWSCVQERHTLNHTCYQNEANSPPNIAIIDQSLVTEHTIFNNTLRDCDYFGESEQWSGCLRGRNEAYQQIQGKLADGISSLHVPLEVSRFKVCLPVLWSLPLSC